MQAIVTTISLFFALSVFSGCVPKVETKYIHKKYPTPQVQAPAIEPRCDDVKCVLVNYQKMKDYAAALREALLEVTE